MANLIADLPDKSPPPLPVYAATMLKQRLEKMLSHSSGVRDGDNIEAVHQMRVWSRRTRAALEIFRSCLSGKEFAAIEQEVKTMADALGEARDLDVMIESLTKRSEALPENQRTGVLSFVLQLKHRRMACQSAVEKAVDRLERHELAARVDRLTATMLPPQEVSTSDTATVSTSTERSVHG